MPGSAAPAKGRERRPGLDALLKDASRRRFDVVMAWAIDRLGRSLIDLLDAIQYLEAVGVDLYLDRQSIDTTSPAGKLLCQMTGAFAEFERSMIRQRVRAGLSVIKAKIEGDGKFVSKVGKAAKLTAHSRTLGSTPSVDACCALLLRIFTDLASNLDSPPGMVQHNDRIAFNRDKYGRGDNCETCERALALCACG